ncbi:MAG: hypothetical protein A2Y76_13385 [Planctomycetes bacterium RBG_13_60_9]|nr:MAG: hypothetical protein A2Y76_13385 [Planctomycetes bacterium RBG_13_60_9]
MEKVKVNDPVGSPWISQERDRDRASPRGIVLLVLLLVLVAVALLSLEYQGRSDVELACGRNMVLRLQMDAMAESGLEHAKGLILHPQEITQEYWTGDLGQQLAAGSGDYYDVNVAKLSECNYRIISTAYRLQRGERIGCTTLKAELRLDPCIAYWQGTDAVIPSQVHVTGDVYCGGGLTIHGTVDGDVFAATTISGSGSIRGHRQEFVQAAPVAWPGLSPTDFESCYFLGTSRYRVGTLDNEVLRDVRLRPTSTNPGGVYYGDGDLDLKGRIEIDGMLVVRNDLILAEHCEVVIRAVKNFPALLVGRDLKMGADRQHLRLEGLAQIGRSIRMGNGEGNALRISGALCLAAGTVEETTGCELRIVAAPNKAAILIWQAPQSPRQWSPAGGAFFKYIERH